jgi:hypothetical protein
MTDDAEAREIAARLTKAQRRAIMLLRPDGLSTAMVDVPAKRVLARLPDLVTGWGAWGPGTWSYQATPLGLRARAILAAQEGGQ